jgi:hypothetical protein
MVERADVSDEVLTAMWELANTPFEYAAFQRAWARFGWVVTAADSFSIQLSLPHEYPLWIDPLGQQILSARLPTCYLDNQDGVLLSVAAANKNRRQFDAEFDALRTQLIALAGPQDLDWQDDDSNAYRAALWKAKHGILVAQQASFDDQFGDEARIWLHGLKLADVVMSTPFVDVLCARSRTLHDAS